MNKKKKSNNTVSQNLSRIYAENRFHECERYLRIHIFHVFLEMLITVYILEMIAFLSKWFFKDPTKLNNILNFVAMPLIVVLPITALFAIVCVPYIIHKVAEYLSDYKDRIPDLEQNYKKNLIIAHCLGVGSYILGACLSAILITHIFKGDIMNSQFLIVCITCVGAFLGITWNCLSYLRLNRVSWRRFLLTDTNGRTDTSAESEKTHLAETKTHNDPPFQDTEMENCYHAYKWHGYCQLASVVVILICLVAILLNLHGSLLAAPMFERLATDYSFVLLAFFSLVSYYLKKSFSRDFFPKDDEIFCPSLRTILSYSTQEKGK